jgi:uncharacterized protein
MCTVTSFRRGWFALLGCLLATLGPVAGQTPKTHDSLTMLEQLAKEGNPKAQNQLGTYYFVRSLAGGTDDYALAVSWFEKAAAQGEANALFNLGVCHERGLGVKVDMKKALDYYRQAADLGLEKAQLNCALTLQEMRGNAEAVKYFTMAANQGNVVCQRELGQMLIKGSNIDQDVEQGLHYLRKAASSGDAQAALFLADCFAGVYPGVERNPEQMVDYLWQAANRNVPEALAKIGFCYEEGIGLPKDTTIAVRWYQRAVERGYHQALINLAECYSVGKGVRQDAKQAFTLYQRAADLNLPLGHFNLGVAYALGEGTPVNERQAFTHFRAAAQAGLARAQYNLGVSYEEGRGTEPDAQQAFHWYREAARQNDANAQFALGMCYLSGKGTAADRDQARAMFEAAARQQHPDAREALVTHFGESPR